MYTRYVLLAMGIALGCLGSASGQFVTLEGRKFMLDGQEFYPLVMNFSVALARDASVADPVSPSAIYAAADGSYGLTGDFDCPSGGPSCLYELGLAFDQVSSMGFNTVRLTGDIVAQYRDAPELGTGERRFSYGVDANPNWPTNRRRYDLDFADAEVAGTYTNRYVQILNEVLNKAEASGLKVILLSIGAGPRDVSTGAQYMYPTYDEYAPGHYQEYLGFLSTALAEHPALLAYDLYNEPTYQHLHQSHYYPGDPGPEHWQSEWTKEDICDFTSRWHGEINEHDQNHFVTIGGSGIDELGVWDMSAVKVDFYSLHLYPQPDYMKENFVYSDALDRYQGTLHWFGQVCPMPWIIGETAFSANDRTGQWPHTGTSPDYHAWPWMHGTEAQQASFAESSLQLSRACGASGWSWWGFQEWRWYQLTDTPPPSADNIRELYYGMLHLGDGSVPWTEKPVVAEVQNYVLAPRPDDPGAQPANYYNPHNLTGSVTLAGTVVDQFGHAMRNALATLTSFSEDDAGGLELDDYFTSHYTFSDVSGLFQFMTEPTGVGFYPPERVNLALAAVGAKPENRGWWGGSIQNNETFVLITTPFELDGVVSDVVIPSETQSEERRFAAWVDLELYNVTADDVPDPGATQVNFVARQTIHVGAEFHAKVGSTVHIYTDEAYPHCDDPSYRVLTAPTVPQMNTAVHESEVESPRLELAFALPQADQIDVFPNPCDRLLHVRLTSFGPVRAQLIDGIGRNSGAWSGSGPELILDLRHLATGVYHIRIEQAANSWSRTIIKQP